MYNLTMYNSYMKKTGAVCLKHRSCSLFRVGKTRLELATTRPPDAYANQLRYFPIDSTERGVP